METSRLRALSALLHKRAAARERARSMGLRVESSCRGSAANAIHMAALHPAFQAQGLRLERPACERALVPRYLDLEGGLAIQCFFGLDALGAEVIFDPESYDESQLCDPGAVAQRIDWWLQTTPETPPAKGAVVVSGQSPQPASTASRLPDARAA